MGGYWSSSIKMSGSEIDLDEWVEDGIGRHIEVYNPGGVLIWEGFVNKVSISSGEDTFSIGPLVEIANKVTVTYSTINNDVDPPLIGARETTASASNSDSQDLYGIWEKIIGLNGATQADAEQLRDMLVNDPTRALPATSGDVSLSGGGALSLSLDLLGYWHWLNAYFYLNAATGDVNLSQKIQDILAADPNGIFSTDYTQIASNTSQVSDSGTGERPTDAIMIDLNSRGDSLDNPYSMGFYEGRQLVYQPIPNEIAYHKRRGKPMTTPIGGKVDPWDVQPAEWFFRPDFLIGRHPPITKATLGTDPRSGLIETVKYSTPWGLSVNGVKLSEVDQVLAKRGMGGMG